MSAKAARIRRPRWLLRWWGSLSPRARRLLVGGVAGFFVTVFGLAGIVYARTRIPLPEDVVHAQSAVVLYADGSRFGVIEADENRIDIPLDKVPEQVREAVLAAEDEGFYGHSGVSLRGMARAAWANVRGARLGQGGSTITQQYVKNAYLSQERTLVRKFKELVISVKLDRRYDKDQILEFYLNTVYFGRNAYGIEAAARTYFGVGAERLTVEQGALLATLIRSPEAGDPARNPELAEKRWRAVLANMVDAGWLDEAKAESARFPEEARRKRLGRQGNRLGGQVGHVFEEIRRELDAAGFDTAKLGQGVVVRTTLLPKAQLAAEAAIPKVLTDVPRDLRAALVAVEPGTGRIRALHAGSDYVVSQFNYATQATKRQPGSSFKPYVLAAALDKGIGLRSRYDGRSPQDIAGEDWENFDDESFGRIDLVEATKDSVNTVYVKLAEDAGIGKVIDTAKAAGIPEEGRHLPRELGLALGSGGVSPLDQATGFATFAAKGERAEPFLVEQVIGKGNKQIYRAEVETERGLDEGVAADVTYALTQVVERGTGQRAKLDGGRPAAGKTGTTSDNVDAWFVGYTPQLSAAVWMGFDDPKRKLVDIQGRNVTGGTFPAPIFAEFMDAALAGEPVMAFPPPAFVGDDKDAATPSPTGTPTPSASSLVPTVDATTVVPTKRPTIVPTVGPTTAEPEPTKTKEPDPTTSPTGGAAGTTPSPPAPT